MALQPPPELFWRSVTLVGDLVDGVIAAKQWVDDYRPLNDYGVGQVCIRGATFGKEICGSSGF